MAKKKNAATDDETTPAAPARRRAPAAPRKRKSETASQPVDIANASAPTEASRASDFRSGDTTRQYEPTHEEISVAAYHRYLQRGGSVGDEFNDWVEAERELRSRNPRR